MTAWCEVVYFAFTITDDIDASNLRNTIISSGKMVPNFLFHYYSHLEKTKQLASNISFEIAYTWYSVLMLKV